MKKGSLQLFVKKQKRGDNLEAVNVEHKEDLVLGFVGPLTDEFSSQMQPHNAENFGCVDCIDCVCDVGPCDCDT